MGSPFRVGTRASRRGAKPLACAATVGLQTNLRKHRSRSPAPSPLPRVPPCDARELTSPQLTYRGRPLWWRRAAGGLLRERRQRAGRSNHPIARTPHIVRKVGVSGVSRLFVTYAILGPPVTV